MKTFTCGHCGGINEVTGLTADIEAFHTLFNQVYNDGPRMLPAQLSAFREKTLKEEVGEYAEAKTIEDKVDALVDLVYFALGTAYLHGVDFNAAFKRVHDKNMEKVLSCAEFPSKRGPQFNGVDVVKPPGWEPPNLRDLCRPRPKSFQEGEEPK